MKKPEPKKSPSVASDLLNSTVAITSLFSLFIVGVAVWMQVRATLGWQSGMEYGFIVLYPFVLLASLVLLINGIILLVRAVRRRNLKKPYRITLAIIGLIFLSPAGYLIQGFVSMSLISYNASRISSNDEVRELVEDCEIRSIRRDYESWDPPADQRKSNAVVYLKNPNMSQTESYFYGHRTFKPEYYDELAKIAISDDVAKRCGKIELYDEHRENIPITYEWVNKDQALAALQECKIRDVHTIEQPKEDALQKASNPGDASTKIFMILDPIAQGYSGTIYIMGADASTQSSILDFAKTKKGSCLYKQPNIEGRED